MTTLNVRSSQLLNSKMVLRLIKGRSNVLVEGEWILITNTRASDEHDVEVVPRHGQIH